MVDATKQILDLNSIFTLKTRKTRFFAYTFALTFVAFTFFLAFNPSPNPSSPLFSNIFSISTSTTRINNSTFTEGSSSNSSKISSDGYVRSHFNSIYSYLFSENSSRLGQSSSSFSLPIPTNVTARSQDATLSSKPRPRNQTQNADFQDKVGVFRPNQTSRSSLGGKNSTGYGEKNSADKGMVSSKSLAHDKNQTQASDFRDKVGVFRPNQTSESSLGGKNSTGYGGKTVLDKAMVKSSTNGLSKSPSLANQTAISTPKASSSEGKVISNKGLVKNFTSSLAKKQISANGTDLLKKEKYEDLVKGLVNCNLADGEWVRDETYPLYKPGSCELIDEQFNCFLNGRPDKGFQQLKWKPNGCTLPRLNASHMLELLRGKRLVFIGDSLNRNMWESLVCILRNSVKDQTKVYEASGRQHFRTEFSYSFVFKDYNCTVEFFVTPFLVRESETKTKNGLKKETLRLDLVESSADQYKTADIVIFNTGHWWTHEKTAKGRDYYQEGSHIYPELDVLEAFRKAMTTWGRWIDANINPTRTSVFFRGYSASHFSGGQWNSGGQCDHETEPIKNETFLSPYPPMMSVLERVMRGMKTRVSYLNVTRLTDFRKDGHPSIYRRQHNDKPEEIVQLQYQDCSHWCLPGVPDAWNEILYAELLLKQYQRST